MSASPSQQNDVPLPPPSIPPNAFDFIADLQALIQRVVNEEMDPKELAHQSNPIRIKIQKARSHVSSLPDIDRTMEDQQKEIEELEDRIERQREMLRSVAELDVVKEVAARSGKNDMMDV